MPRIKKLILFPTPFFIRVQDARAGPVGGTRFVDLQVFASVVLHDLGLVQHHLEDSSLDPPG